MALKDAVKKSTAKARSSDSLDARVVRSGNVLTIEMPSGEGSDVPSFAAGTMPMTRVRPVLDALKDVVKKG